MIRIFLILLILSAFFPLSAAHKLSVKKILFISSYDTSCSSTAEVQKGFLEFFESSGTDSIHVEYMELGILRTHDLKTSKRDEINFRKKLELKKFDLIIALDNAAIDMVLDHAKFIPPSTPFLFSGYAGWKDSLRKKLPNMTGLVREAVFEKTVKFGLHLLPHTQKIAVITDASGAGEVFYQRFRSTVQNGYAVEFQFLHGGILGTEEMLSALTQLPPDSFVILSNWRSIKEEPFSPMQAVYREIVRNAQRPVFTLSDRALDSGAVGGYLSQGFVLGHDTALVASRLLRGEPASEMPIFTSKGIPAFVWNALGRWDLAPDSLPSQTVFLNKPKNIFKEYIPIIIMLGIFFLLILFGLLLAGEIRRRHRKKLNGLFSALPIHVGVVNRKGKILFLQAGNLYFSTRRPERLTDLPVELLREIEEPIREVFRKGERFRKEYGVFGQHRQLEFLPLPEETFGCHCVMWISTDVSELHDAYTTMTQLAQRFRMTLESIGDAVIVTNNDEEITMMNPMANKLIGTDSNQAIGQKLGTVFLFTAPDSPLKEQETPAARVLRSGTELILNNGAILHSGDGTQYRIALSAAPVRESDGTITGAVLFFRDVTDEYNKRNILNMQNSILRNATDVANLVYFQELPDGTILPMGDFEKNWSVVDGHPIPPEEWIDPADLPAFQEQWMRLHSGETNSIHIFYRSKESAGHRYYEMRVSRRNLTDHQESADFYGIIQDITDSRENERKYNDNATLLKSIVDHIPGYLFVKDVEQNFRYVMCNQSFSDLLAKTPSEIIGKHDSELFPSEKISSRKNSPEECENDMEETIVDAAGKKHVLRTMTVIVPQTNGSRLQLGMSIDISRQTQLEQERINMIAKLNNYVQCERIINQCLSRISLETDLNKAVNDMLRVIGENTGADRCFVFQYTNTEKTYSDNIYEWVRNGISTQQEKLRNLDMSATTTHWTKKLLAKENIVIEDISNPPEDLAEEALFLASQEIKSVIACGIWIDNNLWGYIGMDFVHKQKNFSESDIHTVYSSGKLFLLAYERFRQMNAIADSLSLQKQIVENISIPLAIFNREGQIIAANTTLCSVCKIDPENIQSKKCNEIICRLPEQPVWCPMKKTIQDLKPHSAELEILGRYFLFTTQPIFDREHKLQFILKYAMDITELNSQKEQIRKAMETAQTADRTKSDFIATMNKELRTPLNAIIGLSELLQEDHVPREEEKKNLRSIKLAGHTLLNLINDVLDLSNIENETLEIKPVPVNLRKLLSEMLTIFRHSAQNKNLGLELSLPKYLPTLIMDQDRLRQILLNLITNAFKTTVKGTIILSAEFHQEQKHALSGNLILKITESDNGTPPENMEMLFEPFHRKTGKNNPDAHNSSTGLEWTLVQRLCVRMGGTLEETNSDEAGKTVIIRFEKVPCQFSPLQEEHPSLLPHLPQKSEETTILLVDDVSLNLKVMSAMFSRLKLNHICCQSAKEALKSMESTIPAAIYTDLWMPGMNGDELAELLAKNPETAEIPVFAVTADSQIDSHTAKVFKGVILKPLTIDSIEKTLNEIPGFSKNKQEKGDRS